jgi:hypothetical protein
MIGRKLILGVAALALCLGGMSTMAHAKACPAKCRTQIKACRQAKCTGLKHHAKSMCKRDCRTQLINVCKSVNNPTACSPSGAFVE